MTREEAIKILEYQHDNGNMEEAVRQALAKAINALAVYPQFKWERDIAIEQLDEYGISFGAKKDDDIVKVVRCKDSRRYDNRYGDVCHNPRYGDGWANYPPPYVDEDYWCKDGERKGGEDE